VSARILIATPVKDATSHLDTHFALLDRLNYPRAQITLAYLESDSRDGTFEALGARLAEAGGVIGAIACCSRTSASISRPERRARRPRSNLRAARGWPARATTSCLARSTTRTGCSGSMSM
jgi:hypothetical protein